MAQSRLIAQPVRFVDADPIDHFPAVFGDDVEQVIDHARLRALLLHLQVECRVHVLRDAALLSRGNRAS
jgi:hypothetical protein